MNSSIIQDKKSQKIRPWTIILWLLFWQLLSIAIGEQILLVSPIAVVIRLIELIFTWDFWSSILFSLWRISLGFFLGVILGVSFAIISSKYRVIKDLLALPMIIIRSVPVASFIIIILIWFSSKNLSIIISFLMVLPIIYISILQGIEQIDIHNLEMARVFNVPLLRKIRYIHIPEVMPFFLSSTITAIGLAWKSGIAGEVIGMPDGSIGEHLQQAKVYLDTPDIFAWTVVIVVLSIICEKLFVRIVSKIYDLLRK